MLRLHVHIGDRQLGTFGLDPDLKAIAEHLKNAPASMQRQLLEIQAERAAGSPDGPHEVDAQFNTFIPESKQVVDKDGFLLCRDVPVARIGMQLYGPGETPIDAADGEMVRIEREPEEVFHPDTIASLAGAPVVNDHPVDGAGNRCDVTPDNWRQLAIGHVENPRRGTGDLADFLLADLRIHDRDAIDLIRSGKRQVSCGYDADYEALGPGHGRQKNIRCNHLALVDQARCGPACAIGDSPAPGLNRGEEADFAEETTMTAWTERVRALAKQYSFKARDQAELESAIADAEEGKEDGEPNGTHVHVHMPPNEDGRARDQEEKKDEEEETSQDRATARDQAAENEELWQAIEAVERAVVLGGDAKFKPRDSYPHRDARRRRMGIDSRRSRDEDKEDEDKTEDEGVTLGTNREINSELEIEAPPGAQVVDVRKARDSRYLEDSWGETMSLGEILVPGIRLQTFDRAADKQKTYDAMCEFRRRVLDLAYVQPDGRELLDEVTRGRFTGAKGMPCAKVREVFRSAGLAKRRSNNSGRAVTVQAARDSYAAGGATTLAEYQKRLDEHYAKPPS
jgi:hypothetical protein